MRNDDCFIPELDYVIEEEGEIVAQIVWAKATVKEGDKCHTVAIFGPLSVLPTYQGRGYARKLIESTCDMAKQMGYAMVLITGNPDLYHRFGFDSADKYGITYEGVPEDMETPFYLQSLGRAKGASRKGRIQRPCRVYGRRERGGRV